MLSTTYGRAELVTAMQALRCRDALGLILADPDVTLRVALIRYMDRPQPCGAIERALAFCAEFMPGGALDSTRHQIDVADVVERMRVACRTASRLLDERPAVLPPVLAPRPSLPSAAAGAFSGRAEEIGR